jgi:regulator of protease activity HflC (stomatin/prohibitin superfamily)
MMRLATAMQRQARRRIRDQERARRDRRLAAIEADLDEREARGELTVRRITRKALDILHQKLSWHGYMERQAPQQ